MAIEKDAVTHNLPIIVNVIDSHDKSKAATEQVFKVFAA